MTNNGQLDVQAELLKATGYKRVAGESDPQYRLHLREQAVDLDDDVWRGLSNEAQEWADPSDGDVPPPFPGEPDTQPEAKPKPHRVRIKKKVEAEKPKDIPDTRKEASRKARTQYDRGLALLRSGKLRQMTLRELRAYFVLATHACKTDLAWTSAATIAKEIGFKPTDEDGEDTDKDGSMRHVRAALKGLAAKGFIEKVEVGGNKRGIRKTNTWRIVDFGAAGAKGSDQTGQGKPVQSGPSSDQTGQGRPVQSGQPNNTPNPTRNKTENTGGCDSASRGGGCPEDVDVEEVVRDKLEGNHLDERDKEILKQMQKFGIDKKARTLLDQEGVDWCENLCRLLRQKKRDPNTKNIKALARSFAADPDGVNFNELAEDEYDDGLNNEDNYTPPAGERELTVEDDEGIAY